MKKRAISLILVIITCFTIYSQPNANLFTWFKGESIANQTGFYGPIGGSFNTPGARNLAMNGTINGKLYLFGGYGYDGVGNQGYMNDVWEYNPATNIWNNIKGSSIRNSGGDFGTKGVGILSNSPSARSTAATWVANNKLYIYGGDSNFGALNDVWVFDPITNIWTWLAGTQLVYEPGNFGVKGMGDSSTNPPSITGSFTWVYNGNLYLFGGGDYNTLWVFNTTTNIWTWLGGSNNINQTGQYGTLGFGSTSNVPGSRRDGCAASIGSKFYLYGGYGIDETANNFGILADLWEYNVLNGEWKFTAGFKTVSIGRDYSQIDIAPGSRNYSKMISHKNSLYLFGGTDGSSNYFGDLIQFDFELNYWKFKAGTININELGVFLTKGVPHPTAMPGNRVAFSLWNLNDKIYLFGGNSSLGDMNDLWSYNIPCNGPTEFFSTKNGNWNDPTVWSCGRVPENTASVKIKGHTLNLNGNFGIKSLQFQGGNLVVPTTSTLTYYPN
jgi:hypothetical protein